MDTITNQSNLNYHYKIDPNGIDNTKSVTSNTTSTNLITAKLQMVKTVDKAYATIGDTLNYQVVLTNSGNILLSDIIMKDVLPTGLTFVTGSVKVDGIAQPTYDIVSGINLGTMILAGSKTVTFQATVASLPSPNTAINKATSTYNYLVGSLISGTSESNTVTTTINVTNIVLTKTANVTDVEVGNEITYTTTIRNSGNIDATNITFTDVLDAKLSFVTGSVTINGTAQSSYNPNTGFAIANITPTQTVTVVFKATVIK